MRAILVLAFVFAGCQTAPALKPESLLGRNIAAIQAEDSSVLTHIDGRSLGGRWSGYPKNKELEPGEHTVTAYRYTESVAGGFLFKLSAEPEHLYLIKNKVFKLVGRDIPDVWLEDAATGKTVGEVESSSSEAVTERTPVFTQSKFFTFAPPQGEEWAVLQRNNGAVVLAKEGKAPEETWVISITVSGIPEFASQEKFLEHLVKARNDYGPDPDRYEKLKIDVEPYAGRKDFCARLYTLVIDKKPVTKADKEARGFSAVTHAIGKAIAPTHLTLEVYGYACRHPTNRNIGLVFEYSRRFPGNVSDVGQRERAEKAFAALKF
jgi:hypothetical protein